MAEPNRNRSASSEPLGPAHVLVIEARYYDAINDDLLAGARATLEHAGATVEVITVPGALEVPPALSILIQADPARYHAVVALGCIIRGETYHFEIVANESARGLTALAVDHALPVGNAILTVENEEQARVRADPARGNKGGEAAEAALTLLRLKRRRVDR